VSTAELIGWRAWLVRDGELLPPYASTGPHADCRPWRPGVNLARCYRQHPAPSPSCECGFRVMVDIYELRSSLDLRALKLHPDGPRYFTGRWTLDDLGAVGLAALSGVLLGPSPSDPPGTSRGSRGKLLRLWLHERHADAADGLASRLRVPVEVGLPV
jgi:hypothetical protein